MGPTEPQQWGDTQRGKEGTELLTGTQGAPGRRKTVERRRGGPRPRQRETYSDTDDGGREGKGERHLDRE